MVQADLQVDPDLLGILHRELSTPAILVVGMSDEEIRQEFENMMFRAWALDRFLKNEMPLDTYEDILRETRVDVVQAREDWENGANYLVL